MARAKAAVKRPRGQSGPKLRASPDLAALFLAHHLEQTWKVLRDRLQELQTEPTSDAVHDLRVALRRAEAAVALTAATAQVELPRRSLSRLKDLRRALVPLRRTDVLLTMTDGLETFSGLEAFRDWLHQEPQHQAESAREYVAERGLPSRPWRHHQLYRALKPGRPPEQRVARYLGRVFEDVEAARAAVDPTDIETLHQLRIALKRYRYTVEPLQPIWTAVVPNKEAFEAMQERLGELRDTADLIAALEEFAAKESDEDAPVGRAVSGLKSQHEAALVAVAAQLPAAEKLRPGEINNTYVLCPAPSEGLTELYILRHGEAGATSPDLASDAERHLSPRGRTETLRSAKGLRRRDFFIDAIVSSPLARARETAEIMAEALHVPAGVKLEPALSPQGAPQDLLQSLQQRHGRHSRLMLVGHEPYLSALISVLISATPDVALRLKKGGLCKLEVENLHYGRSGALAWVLTPHQVAART